MKSRILFTLGIVIPLALAFKAYFGTGSLVAGDAPYFTDVGLKELIAEPYAWTTRGNNFGGVNDFLWLSPIMLIYGFLHMLFGLNNAAILKILFYFPSLILSILGPIFFARYLKLSRRVQFFASLFYVFNTFYLLIVDGGQVGIALAYGLFPFGLLVLIKYIKKSNLNNFYICIIGLQLLIFADPRYALVAIIFGILWNIKLINIYKILLLVTSLFGVNLYWIYPMIKIGEENVSLEISGLQFVTFRHAITIFQPHWPANVFGEITNPYFYFYGLSILVILSLIINYKNEYTKKIFILFIIAAFLVSGKYINYVSNIPYSFAFRDSTKFVSPLILMSGLLIGLLADKVNNKIFSIIIYIYLIFMIFPAIRGEMNGVLSGGLYKSETSINENSRTAWFPEKHGLAFESKETQLIDAKKLTDIRPIASFNVGSFDKFNFLNNPQATQWFDLLRIDNYVLNNHDIEEKEKLSGLLTNIFETSFVKPKLFTTDKLLIVVGNDSIYDKLKNNISDQALVFVEDGKFDPHMLENIDSESAVLVFEDKTKEDLTLSFLQEYFMGINKAKHNWAYYAPNDYLTWQYQLLIRDLETKEYDYDKGIALSTNSGEEIEVNLKAAIDGKYVLAIRQMALTNPAALGIALDDKQWATTLEKSGNFNWFTAPVEIKKGKHILKLLNGGGSQVINVVALIPETEYNKAVSLADVFAEHFETIDTSKDILKIDSTWQELDYEKMNPTRYKINLSEQGNWVIFSDSYHSLWRMERRGHRLWNGSLPFYSAINGFYRKSDWDEVELIFEGQRKYRLGICLSALSLLSLSIVFLYHKSED